MWQALFRELGIQNELRLLSPLMVTDYCGHEARKWPGGFSHRPDGDCQLMQGA